MAAEVFSGRFVNTGVPPAVKAFRKLVEALGIPLNYDARMEGHDVAGTCRRAWMKKMMDSTAYGVIGMISPSLNEWHANPNGIGYYHNPSSGVDPSRLSRPCNICQSRRCAILEKARDDKRVVEGGLAMAIASFKHHRVDYLWLLNI